MAQVNFPACLAFTLAAEGGWSDDPRDNGGQTMKGVTLRTFQQFFPGGTADQLRHITDDQLSTVYHTGYWAPVHGDDLPSGVDLVTWDFGVNAGPARAVKMLQRTVGVVDDGIIGPASLAAIRKASPTDLITKLIGAQREYYRSLPTFDEFGRGWMNRTDQRAKAALQLVGKAT